MLRNPGSPEALTAGCRCDPRKNLNGKGAGQNGRGESLFVVHKQCPLHGDEKFRREPA